MKPEIPSLPQKYHEDDSSGLHPPPPSHSCYPSCPEAHGTKVWGLVFEPTTLFAKWFYEFFEREKLSRFTARQTEVQKFPTWAGTLLAISICDTKTLASRPPSPGAISTKERTQTPSECTNDSNLNIKGICFIYIVVTAISPVETDSPNPRQTPGPDLHQEMSPFFPDSAHPVLLRPQREKKKKGPKLLFQKIYGRAICFVLFLTRTWETFIFLSELHILESF